MYLRREHAELDIPTLQQFIRENPLGLLITGLPANPEKNFPALQCTHIPWVLDTPSQSELGGLRGHMARANPHTKALIEAFRAQEQRAEEGDALESEVTVLFQGPAHHYITPSFYTTTKPSTGKVVPTWNYTAVQCYGTLKVHTASDSTFLQRALEDLSHQSETTSLPKDLVEEKKEWTVSDAPDKYIDLLKKAIIGAEIRIEKLEGRMKMSQELAEGDWEGVVTGFEEKVEGKGGERMRDEVVRWGGRKGKVIGDGVRREDWAEKSVNRRKAESLQFKVGS